MDAVIKENHNVDKALILAMDDTGIQPLFGIANIRRLVLILKDAGVHSIHLIGRIRQIKSLLSDLIPEDAFHPLDDPVFLSDIAGKIVSTDSDYPKPMLVLRSDLTINRYFFDQFLAGDPDDVPRLMEIPSTKGLGLYLVSPSEAVSCLQALWQPGESLKFLAEKASRIKGGEGFPFLLEKGQMHVERAEAALISGLASQTESSDGFIARYFDRPISRFISKRLARSAMTPNQITFIGVTIGLIGAVLFSRPDYGMQLSGAFLFLTCVIIDGVDGEVARLKLMETSFGHYLDIITDNLVHIAVFAGIAVGLSIERGNPFYLRVFWILMGGFGLCGLAVYRCVLKPGSKDPERSERSSKTIRFLSLMTNRDFAYLLVLLAAIHRLDWFLLGAAVGTYIFAATLWVMHRFESK